MKSCQIFIKDEQKVLALDNIEQCHLLEDPDLWKEFHKSLCSEDIPEADEDDNLEGTNVRNTTRNQHQIQFGTY